MSEKLESKQEIVTNVNGDLSNQSNYESPKPPEESSSNSGILYFFICLCLALVLFFVVAPKFEDIDTYGGLTETLDEKREQVIGLSATLAGLSVAVALVPGDSTTPIADNIANLSSYLVIVLGAIMLEKFLIPIMAFISWRLLIPVGIVLLGIFILLKRNAFREWAVRLIVFGVMVFSIIPVGIKVGDLIDNAFNMSASLEQIKAGFAEIDGESDEAKGNEAEEEEDKNIIEKAADKILDVGSNLLGKAKLIVGEILEVIAAFIVTTCVIPLGVIFIIYAIAKGILSMFMYRFNIRIPEKPKEETSIQEQ